MPLVTIIIPVFNSEKTIVQTLKPILTQSFSDIEILIIDDGSTDSTCNIISEINDSRIKIISQKNSGTVSAYTLGIKNANSEYIMFCDSDDFYKESYIKDAYERITSENVDVVTYKVNYVSLDNELLKTSKQSLSCGKYERTKIENEILSKITFNSFKSGLTHIIPVFRFNKIYKKDLLLKVVDDLDLSIKQLEDNIFTTSVLLNANSIYIDDKIEYDYVQQNVSVSTGYRPNLFDEYEKSILYLEKIFDKYSYKIDSIQYTKLIIASIRVILRRIARSSKYQIYKNDFKTIVHKSYIKDLKLNKVDDSINLIFLLLLKMRFSFITYFILKKIF